MEKPPIIKFLPSEEEQFSSQEENVGPNKIVLVKSSGPTPENLAQISEKERKKQVKRTNRVKEIIEIESTVLNIKFPEEVNNFEIGYEEIQEMDSGMFEGSKTIFRNSEKPVYGIFLKLKSDPDKKYQITYFLRGDLDAKKETFDMLKNQSMADGIKKGIEKLKQDKK